VADPVQDNAGPLDSALVAAPELEGFLRRRGHGEAARDLVQDLFVVLLTRKNPPDASAPGRFRSFLFAIAYRLSANAARRRSRSHAVSLEERGPDMAAPAPSPELRALQRENVLRAAAALDALPEDVRRTLLYVADEGLSTRDVAKRMSVSEEVVRARLSRGRRRLAAVLMGKDEE
jgi:RNA polymerase sigma-70 factor (ECF subfamily)